MTLDQPNPTSQFSLLTALSSQPKFPNRSIDRSTTFLFKKAIDSSMADDPAEESMRLLRMAVPPCDEKDQENMEKRLMDTDSTADDSKINDGLSEGSKGITFEGLMADMLEDLEAACKQRETDEDQENMGKRLMDTDSTADDSKINDGLSKGSKGITIESLTADLLEDLEADCKQREIDKDMEWILEEILKFDVYSFPSNDSRV